MEEAAEDPWKPLLRVGQGNQILCLIVLVGVFVEFCQWALANSINADPWFLMILLLDFFMALGWGGAGYELREQRSTNLTPSVVVASIALADSLVSAFVRGPRLIEVLSTEELGAPWRSAWGCRAM